MNMCFSHLNKSHLTKAWLLFFVIGVGQCVNAQAGSLSAQAQSLSAQGQSVEESLHIRVLAASCAACHGTNGNSVSGTPVLAGLDKNHFVLQMQAFRSGERSSTVMYRHAKGLAVDEIDQLATYFSQQKRVTPVSPINQTLDVNRE